MSAPAARADRPRDVIAILEVSAKGVLAERLAIGPEDAFILLRRSARSSRVKLHDLAAAVIASRETPPQIRLVLERWEQRLDPSAVR